MTLKLTEFQKAVYAAALSIPLGQTRTYKWVAARIGRPKSARAVGNALRMNPYAPWVPCHRVVASDGTLGGYSGGLRKKIDLLKKEKKYKNCRQVSELRVDELRSGHEYQRYPADHVREGCVGLIFKD